MKVKIKNKIYDSDKEPIMVILSDEDKKNISAMHKECDKYCSAPDKWSGDGIFKWMEK